jgi:transposase
VAIWNFGLEAADEKYIFTKYSKLGEIQQCIVDFREIYNEKSPDLLKRFIDTYSKSNIKPIASCASGLRCDGDAVKKSVVSKLSNGFVEGINNKIKLIKRMMFGRAKIDLLRIRVLFAKQPLTGFCG